MAPTNGFTDLLVCGSALSRGLSGQEPRNLALELIHRENLVMDCSRRPECRSFPAPRPKLHCGGAGCSAMLRDGCGFPVSALALSATNAAACARCTETEGLRTELPAPLTCVAEAS